MTAPTTNASAAALLGPHQFRTEAASNSNRDLITSVPPMRTPRHLLALFLAVTLLPAAALVWAGWKLFRQDRILEQQSIEKRRDVAADLIVTALQQGIVATQQRLADPAARENMGEDTRVIAIDASQPALLESPEEAFPSGNGPDSMDRLRALTRSSDPAIRAGADLRLARILRNTGQSAAALDVYSDLAKQQGVAVAGNPADLVARTARCGLLAELNRTSDLRREAQQLETDLFSSRWPLDYGRFGAALAEMDTWMGRDPSQNIDGLTLSEIDFIWNKWQDNHEPGSFTGSKSVFLGNQSSTLVWTASSDSLIVLLAGPRYLEGTWLASLDPILKNQEVRVALLDTESHALFGDPIASAPSTTRASSDTHLPWTLQIASIRPEAELAQSDDRRRLYLAGLGLLLSVAVAGSYFMGRAVTRELAVARLQSDFVAAVSHEFRTPLTSLRQVTEMLSDGRQADPSRLSGYYQAQTRAADRLQRLVESLLDFGRMEAGAKPYRMQRLAVSEFVESVIKELQDEGAVGQCQLEFKTHCDNGSAALVYADPDALGRALRNLIDNAVKYSPDCHTVWVELSRRDNRLAIRVRDKGLGIPVNEHKPIFRKFVRGAASKTNGIKGTGVGLAMVQQIVQAHGGQIELESQPGAGSTFTILLPESRS